MARTTAHSPGNKHVSRVFPNSTDGAKRRPRVNDTFLLLSLSDDFSSVPTTSVLLLAPEGSCQSHAG
jgi:hypothetical protein